MNFSTHWHCCVLYVPEELNGTLVDLPSFIQTLPGIFLLPPTQHELFVGFVTLGAIMMGGRLQHCRGHIYLFQDGRQHIQ